jgi:hypothetical protein
MPPVRSRSQGIVSQDGYVEFTATETTTDRMCGLSHGDSDQGYTDIDYAIYLTAMARCKCTKAAFLAANFGAYVTGDVFRVALEGGAIIYRKNGTVFYTSLVTPTQPLLVDTTLYSPGATLSNVVLHGVLTGVPAGVAPIVSMSGPANNTAFAAQAAITLQASASASSGSVVKVEFYNGSTKLGDGTPVAGQPGNWFLLLSSGFSAGSYSLTAVATDNLGLTATSAPTTIQVNPSQGINVTFNPLPVGTTFSAPGNLTLSVNAFDASGGTISKVEFYQGNALLGTVTASVPGQSSTFTFPLTLTSAGSYLFTAKAYNSSGLSTTTDSCDDHGPGFAPVHYRL